MNTFYTTQLYPLQDKVLAAVAKLNTPFYLTGGTALSRGYYGHRYSDDLDFFTNSSPQFSLHTDAVIQQLQPLKIAIKHRSNSFVSIDVKQILKVDFVNDVQFRYGQPVDTPLFPRLDNVRNILSNKLSALISRDEPKDVVDIWIIATHEQINWIDIFTDVNSKAVGIFPPQVVERLKEFPASLLKQIKWIDAAPDSTHFQADITRICHDILAPITKH